MAFYLKGYIYRIFIDPLLSGVRTSIIGKIDKGSRIIDIACGTGSLALSIAGVADHVTGIDLDEKLICYADKRAINRGLRNRIQYEVHDATSLLCYHDREFDIAVTSMSVHQFDSDIAVRVLREMQRIASKVIIADYNCPRPAGLSGFLAYMIERMARSDHSRNYNNYMKKGGLGYFTGMAGLSVISEEVRGNGVFIIAVCE